MPRRRRRKQNKLFSIKYQSYHRHHLIRISSCHILQRAKKTKKTKFSSKKKVIEKIIAIHPSTIPSRKKSELSAKKMSHCSMHSIFGKWCSFPQELSDVKKKNPMPDVTPSIGENEKPLLLTNRKKILLYIANFYVTRNIILQSASCFQHFCCQI